MNLTRRSLKKPVNLSSFFFNLTFLDAEDVERKFQALNIQLSQLSTKSEVHLKLNDIFSNLKILNSTNQTISISLDHSTTLAKTNEIVLQRSNCLNPYPKIYSLAQDSQFVKIKKIGLYEAKVYIFESERGIKSISLASNDSNLMLNKGS